MNKIFRHKHEVIQWLEKMDINLYSIEENKDTLSPFKFTVSVRNNVNLKKKGLTYLPIQFDVIEGNFDCSNNQLISLLGSPKEVHGVFDCSYNKLTSLQYAPTKIKRDLEASHNEIVSLEHCPHIMGSYSLSNNKIKSLLGLPNCIYDSLYIYNNELENLEYCPKKIYNLANFADNKITSLHNTIVEVQKNALAIYNNPIDMIHYEDLENIQVKSLALNLTLLKKINIQEKTKNKEFALVDMNALKEHLKIDYEKRQLENLISNKQSTSKIKL